MSIKEIDIQTHLVDAAIELGGHAFKAAHRTKRGVVDLSVQLPEFLHVYVEVKFKRKFINNRKRSALPFVDLALTPHQRKFIADHRASGGVAGWVMVVAMNNGRYALCASAYVPGHGMLPYDEHDPAAHGWFFKERGSVWPIKEVIQHLQNARQI